MQTDPSLPLPVDQPDIAPSDAAPPWPIAPSFAADGPLFIVLNAGSGADAAADRADLIRQTLAASGRTHALLQVAPGSSIAAVAREAVRRAEAEQGAVVVAGGDGTVNAVAALAVAAGLPFGVLPQGTFNFFSREHGIPDDPQTAIRALLRARLCPVQVGLVNDQVFLVNGSLGLYPELLEDREAYKRRYGRSRLVALWSALVSLMSAQRPLRLRIEQAGQVRDVRTPTLFVGNNRVQLDRLGLADAPALDRQRLVAILLRPVGPLAMLGLILHGAIGRLGDDDDVDAFAFRQITVYPAGRLSRRRIKVATDGEVRWLSAPLTFRVSPRPLWLLAPRSEDAVEPA